MDCANITDWCHAEQPRYGTGQHCHAPIINGVPLCNHGSAEWDDDTLLFLTDY